MAFYHVGSCSCPEGCCDCGSPPATHAVFCLTEWTPGYGPKLEVRSYTGSLSEVRGHAEHWKTWRGNPQYRWRSRFISVVPIDRYAQTDKHFEAMLKERLR